MNCGSHDKLHSELFLWRVLYSTFQVHEKSLETVFQTHFPGLEHTPAGSAILVCNNPNIFVEFHYSLIISLLYLKANSAGPGGYKPLQQVMNRLCERLTEFEVLEEDDENELKLLKLCSSQQSSHQPNSQYYKRLKWRGILLRVDRIGDSFVRIKGDLPMRVEQIIHDLSDGEVYVRGNSLLPLSKFIGVDPILHYFLILRA